MSLPVAPADTVAVVVGIERYAVGDAWNLDGPASDAARMIAWLRARGVPAENIFAFISALPANAAAVAEVQGRGVMVRDAHSGDLRAVFADTLPGRAGALLLVYWGGHGVVTEGFERRLFYADATRADKRNLTFSSLLLAGRTASYKGFRRQVTIIDACANYFEEMRAALDIRGDEIPRHRTLLDDVTQDVLYASAAGEVAINDNLKRSGEFSDVLFAELAADPAFPPDFVAISARVDQHFQARRRTGTSRQTPVQYHCELNTVVQDTGGVPAAGTVQAAARRVNLSIDQVRALATALAACPAMQDRDRRDTVVRGLGFFVLQRHDQAERDLQAMLTCAIVDPASLTRLFDQVELVETDSFSIQSARERAERVLLAADAAAALSTVSLTESTFRSLYLMSAPDFLVAPDTRDRDDQLERLADMAPRPGAVVPLIEFMERVYRRTPAAIRVAAWLDDHASPQQRAATQARLTEEEVLAQGAQPYLAVMIRTTRLRPNEPTEVEAWLRTGNPAHDDHWLEPCQASLDSARDAVLAMLSKARAVSGPNLTIELLMPREQLCFEPEHWQPPADEFNPATPIGRDNAVVLRWRERVRDPEPARRGSWVSRMEIIRQRARAGIVADVLWVSPQAYDREGLHRALGRGAGADCIGLAFVPPDAPADMKADLVVAALTGGAPIVYWVRREPGDWAEVRRQLTNLTMGGPLETLPQRLLALRQNDAVPELARSLSVVCDRPDHEPQPTKATTPGQRGS